MNWLRLHWRAAVLVGITLLLPALLYLYGLAALLGLGADFAAERGRLEPRLARLQGLAQRRQLLLARSDAALEALRQRAYPAGEDASSLAATLQTRLRQLFSDAGLQVSNSQVLPPTETEQFQQVSLKVTVQGSLASLDAALVALGALRPRVLVASFDASPARRSRRGTPEVQDVTAVIQLFALRELA